MGKRLLSLCMALALCLGLLPATALAAGEHDGHSNGWTELTADTTTLSGGSYYLSGDVEYTGTASITVSGEVILCLNGHKLDLNGHHISVGSGASLTLYDCSTGGVLTGGSGDTGGGVYVAGGGTFTMTGGSIAGNTANAGGGVYVAGGGTFTMEDGSINNNQTTSGGGGGVMVNKGSFTLSGGSITGNTTNSDTFGYGGGVCLYGAFYLSGAPIIQNNTKNDTANNLYLGWQTINITGPLGKNAHIGVTAENVPRSFISGWSNNMVGENPADYFSSDGDACGIGLNADGDVVLGSLCTTITLNPNGGALPEYSLVAGAALPIPTKTGYTFAGWYENPKFSGTPVTDIPTNSTENLNFYAKWTVNIYTITANVAPAGAGTVKVNGSGTSATVEANSDVTLTATANEGYRFVGWKAVPDTVTIQDNKFTMPASDVTVTAQFAKMVTGVSLDKTSLSLYTGSTGTLTATVEPDDATNQNVTWTSSNTGVATVDTNGKVTAVGAGTAQITATAADGSGKSATCTITVEKPYTPPPYIPPTKTPSQQAIDKIEDAKEGSTVKITLRTGQTKLDKEVFEELAGRDVTLEISLPGGATWTVNGEDIPKTADLTDLDMGVSLNTSTIPAAVINAVSGEIGTVQLTLKHDGPFGFTMTLTAPVGKENEGLWANLYHYDEDAGEMVYQTAALVDEDGNAALLFDHASQYAIVIDDKSHDLPFTDLGEGQWYEPAVAYAYRHNIMEGTSDTTFVPRKSLTRAEAVQVLYNLEGQPDISDENLGYPYEDVNAQAWYGDAVYWARITGVATGYGDGTFQPTDSITRQEFAQMLYNYAKYKGCDMTAEGDLSTFPDSGSVADWAEAAMSWANGNELINGHDDGTLEPGGTTTRAQAASILMRFDLNLVKAR